MLHSQLLSSVENNAFFGLVKTIKLLQYTIYQTNLPYVQEMPALAVQCIFLLKKVTQDSMLTLKNDKMIKSLSNQTIKEDLFRQFSLTERYCRFSQSLSFVTPLADVHRTPAVLEDEFLLEAILDVQLLRVWIQNPTLNIGNIHIK